MVFRGTFMGSAIAAKQVFADNSKEELEDFYREASREFPEISQI